MKKVQKVNTRDKCNICGWEGPSDDVIHDRLRDAWLCPSCGSEDVDDANTNPYEDDDDEENDLWFLT